MLFTIEMVVEIFSSFFPIVTNYPSNEKLACNRINPSLVFSIVRTLVYNIQTVLVISSLPCIISMRYKVQYIQMAHTHTHTHSVYHLMVAMTIHLPTPFTEPKKTLNTLTIANAVLNERIFDCRNQMASKHEIDSNKSEMEHSQM